VKRGSFAPWLVALVCLGPFAAALLIYYGPFGSTWLPQLPGSRELLREPVALPQQWRSADERPWQLVYATMSPCEQQCLARLGRLRQVQLALGRDAHRVQRAAWYAGGLPIADPELTAHALDDEVGRGVVEALGAERLRRGCVLVTNPRGLVILSYPPDVEQKELLRDLERLLSGSDA
jgi:hypothetical protein